MTSTADIREKVVNLVSSHLGVEKEKIKDESSFAEDLGADSLDQMEIVMAFEEEFGCEISDEVAEKIKTVKDAVEHIANNS